MSQRHSEYARMPGDTYVTPQWVYDALYSVEPWAKDAWDCAPINSDFDFLDITFLPRDIATNPPFSLANEFCRHGLQCGRMAMLLPLNFDAAKGRRDLFADNKSFKAQHVLTKRIRWENLVQKKAGPSQNHCWYVWDHGHTGPPIKGWL
jgi:hypothetical protein